MTTNFYLHRRIVCFDFSQGEKQTVAGCVDGYQKAPNLHSVLFVMYPQFKSQLIQGLPLVFFEFFASRIR